MSELKCGNQMFNLFKETIQNSTYTCHYVTVTVKKTLQINDAYTVTINRVNRDN